MWLDSSWIEKYTDRQAEHLTLANGVGYGEGTCLFYQPLMCVLGGFLYDFMCESNLSNRNCAG